jgi:quinol monooxygenase YgiN
MNHSENAVSIHPYFKIRSGNLDAVKALLPAFLKKAATETGMLNYGFSLNGDTLFCREAYADAAALLAHIENVGPELQQVLSLTEVIRIEVHGPAAELDKLRGPLADLKPSWFVWLGGAKR